VIASGVRLSTPAPFNHLANVSVCPKPTLTHGSPIKASWPWAVRISWYGGTPGSLTSKVCAGAMA